MTSAHPDGTVVLDVPDQNERRPSPTATQRIAFVVSALGDGPAGEAALAWISFFADAGNDVEAVAIRGRRASDPVPASVSIRRPGSCAWTRAERRGRWRNCSTQRRYDAVVAVGTVANLRRGRRDGGAARTGPSSCSPSRTC